MPDKIDDLFVIESKNVTKISARDTKQIADEVTFATATGRQTVVRTRSSTDVGRIQNLITSGDVVRTSLPNIADDGFRMLSPLESGLFGAGAGLAGNATLSLFTTGVPLSPYSGSAQTGFNPRASK